MTTLFTDNIPLKPVKDITYNAKTFCYEDMASVYSPPADFSDYVSEGVWVRLRVGDDERCGQVTKVKFFDDHIDVYFRNEAKA